MELSSGLTFRAFSDDSVALLGFQRTSHISKSAREARMIGDFGPLKAEASSRREEILRAVLRDVEQEHATLVDAFAGLDFLPLQIVDIGCGQALADALLARDFPQASFTLVDIEATVSQHHGWSDTGAGYANLAEAKAFLEENGVPSNRVTTINPIKEVWDMLAPTADLVTSYWSCGFHYPVDQYLELFLATLARGGRVVLDLRRKYQAQGDPPLTCLFDAAKTVTLAENRKARRLLFEAR